MFGHLFFFIAVVFVTSRLTARSETVAVLCNGISFNRMLRPFLLCSIAVGVFGFYLSNYLLPAVNVKRYAFEQTYYRNRFVNSFLNIHIQTAKDTQIYVHHFSNSSATGYMFSKETFSKNGVKQKITANTICFDSVSKQWTMYDYTVREINGKNESLTKGIRKEIDLKGIMPDDFNNILRVDALTLPELNKAIERERMKGTTKTRDLYVEKYQRIFNPLAYIILTVIGVSLSCKKTRGGTGLNLAISTALAFSLILLIKIFNASAINGNLTEILAPLIPLAIYSVIAAFLLKYAPK